MVSSKAGKTLTTPSVTKPALILRLQGTKTRTPRTKSKEDTTSFLDCIDEEDEENNITGEVDVTKEDTSPLSAVLESVKKLLVSVLSLNSNVETMVELANKAFETLDRLHADYAKLYDAVKAQNSNRAQLFSTESELGKHPNEEADAVLARGEYRTRAKAAKEAFEALARSEAEFLKFKVRLGQVREEVGALQGECKRCLESHLAIKNVGEELAVQEEEMRKIVVKIEKIKQRCNKVEAGVELSIMLLSSLSSM